MAWTAPRTWVSLEKVTAALMNTHLRDNIDIVHDAAFIAEGDSVTVHTGTEQDINSGAYAEVFDLSGAYALLSGAFYGIDAGIRLTIDGTVALNVTSTSRGEPADQSTTFSVLSVPPARSVTSLKLEVYHAGGGIRAFGWRVFTKAL